MERGGARLASSERESKAENCSNAEAQRLRKASTMKFRAYLLSLHVLPDTSAKIWPKFSQRSKIEIVTGEHDVERGGASLASSGNGSYRVHFYIE